MRKQRTRQHIIADLGFNYIEKQILNAGYILNRLYLDYGYDGSMITFDSNGELEPGHVFFQIKATDQLKISKKHQAIEFSLSKKDLNAWITEPSIVFLTIYDARKEVAYYLNIQKYFSDNHLRLENIKKYLQIFINPQNLFTPDVVKNLGNQKNLQLWT